MERRNIGFPEPLIAAAEKIAAAKHIKFPDVVRRALEEYIEKWKASENDKTRF